MVRNLVDPENVPELGALKPSDIAKVYQAIDAAAVAPEVKGSAQTPKQPRPPCHYCGAPGITRDHIVPVRVLKARVRGLGPSLLLPGHQGSPLNTVPSCSHCNSIKADFRSTCDCDTCIAAWSVYGLSGWEKWPRVDPAGGKALLKEQRASLGMLKPLSFDTSDKPNYDLRIHLALMGDL